MGLGFCEGSLKRLQTDRINTETAFTSDDFRRLVPRFETENLAANQKLIDFIEALSAAKQKTPVQIALAWVLAQKDWIVPIPGTRRIEWLEENLGALTVTFSADELAELNARPKAIPIQGERYRAEYAKRVAD